MSTLKQETAEAPKSAEPQAEIPETALQAPLPEIQQGESKSYSRRILLHTEANAAQLASGHFLKVMPSASSDLTLPYAAKASQKTLKSAT